MDVIKITGLVNQSRNDDDKNYFDYVEQIAKIFPYDMIESLQQLVNGPVFDGDVISKFNRDNLIKMGIATRVCYRGQQGFTAAAYIGYTILKVVIELEEKRITEQNEQAMRRYDAGVLSFKEPCDRTQEYVDKGICVGGFLD